MSTGNGVYPKKKYMIVKKYCTEYQLVLYIKYSLRVMMNHARVLVPGRASVLTYFFV